MPRRWEERFEQRKPVLGRLLVGRTEGNRRAWIEGFIDAIPVLRKTTKTHQSPFRGAQLWG